MWPVPVVVDQVLSLTRLAVALPPMSPWPSSRAGSSSVDDADQVVIGEGAFGEADILAGGVHDVPGLGGR